MYWLAALQMSKVTEKLPPDFLMKTGIFLLIVLVIVIAVKIYQGSNKIFLSIFLCAVFGVVFFSWIYNRNEPAFLTPIIEPLSQFFPTKDYEKKDVSDLDNMKKAGNKPKPKQ
jgi:MFS superfamily sulfate permease-like transporter